MAYFYLFLFISIILKSSQSSDSVEGRHEELEAESAAESLRPGHKCPSVERFPRTNPYDVDPNSYFGNSQYGSAWERIVEKRRSWGDERFWTNPSDFETSPNWKFIVHSIRTKDRRWNFRGDSIRGIDEEHAKHRVEILDKPQDSLSKRLLSLSLIDREHPQIFGACAGWILRVDPSSIFATANTDMNLVNPYGKAVLDFASSKECWEAMCGRDGKSVCDNLRLHLLTMYNKYDILSPSELLRQTSSDGEFPYNEIAVLGKSPDSMLSPTIIGVVFGDDTRLYPSHVADCGVLRNELEAKAKGLGIPVIQLPKTPRPKPDVAAAATSDYAGAGASSGEIDDSRGKQEAEIAKLQVKLKALEKLVANGSNAAARVSENLREKIRKLSTE